MDRQFFRLDLQVVSYNRNANLAPTTCLTSLVLLVNSVGNANLGMSKLQITIPTEFTLSMEVKNHLWKWRKVTGRNVIQKYT